MQRRFHNSLEVSGPMKGVELCLNSGQMVNVVEGRDCRGCFKSGVDHMKKGLEG